MAVDNIARGMAAKALENQGGGGSSLPIVNTATVGQTIRVAAVDENGKPTEWEAVDMTSGGGEKIPIIQESEFGTVDEVVSIEFTDLDKYDEILFVLFTPYCTNQDVSGQTWINGKQYTKDWYNIQTGNVNTYNFIYLKKVADGIYQGHEGTNANSFRVTQIHRLEFTLFDIAVSSLKLVLSSALKQRDDPHASYYCKASLYGR